MRLRSSLKSFVPHFFLVRFFFLCVFLFRFLTRFSREWRTLGVWAPTEARHAAPARFWAGRRRRGPRRRLFIRRKKKVPALGSGVYCLLLPGSSACALSRAPLFFFFIFSTDAAVRFCVCVLFSCETDQYQLGRMIKSEKESAGASLLWLLWHRQKGSLFQLFGLAIK